MRKITTRWPGILIAIGIFSILVYAVQNIQKTQPNIPSQDGTPQHQSAVVTLPPDTAIPPTTMPTITLTPSPTETATPTTTPTLTPTATPTSSPTQTPTSTPTLTSTSTPTWTAVPIIPTTGSGRPTPTEDSQPTATAGLLTVTPTPDEMRCSPDVCIPRFGASGKIAVISAAYQAGLPFSNYFNWELELDPIPVGTADFWQMIRVNQAGIRPPLENIALAAQKNPGSIWIIGNEPDIGWQDNTTPERYAELYHDAYYFIKEQDASARIAVAGVGQPTPLRLLYLDHVLETYMQNYGEPMPVDVWTIHNFILREERDSWGVGIPTGITQESGAPINQGILYDIDDHDNLEIFEQNLINFRQWMANRGYRDRPLAVTEFGILLPADFGFPPPVVAQFLTGTFDFLAWTTDPTIGYPADENHLVQWSFWYSVYDPQEFPTGNLYEPETGELTTLGSVFTDFINGN
ncbi:MAG: hypothetical protein WAM60_19230 [Candidatus Promineifilaceae bacterium]